MPQVPISNDNQVRLNPLSSERFDAPDIGAGGRMMGRAMQSLGQVAQKEFDDLDALQAEARAKKADAEYTAYARERMFGEGGYYTLEGEDAISAKQVVEQDLQKKRGELLARASGRERGMLETVLTRRGEEEAGSIARHAMTQGKVFADQVSQARIISSSDDYATYTAAGDTERADAARATILSELVSENDRKGRNDPHLIDTRRIEVLTGLHQTTIETLALKDPRAAKDYLDKHRGEIDSKTELALDNELEPLLVGNDVREIADLMEGEFTTSVGEAVPADAGANAEPRAVRVANYSARPTPGAPRLKGFPRSYRDAAYDTLDQRYEAKYGLPQGLLSAIRLDGERSNANQVSTAGARGVYQFIASTRQGFIRNYGIDPWRSADEQAEAAALHLRDDFKKYGSWEAAIAAYNGGKRGVTNPVKETRDYVARVTAGLASRGQSTGTAPTAQAVAREDMNSQIEQGEALIREKFAGLGPRQVQLRVDAYKAEVRARHAEREAARSREEEAEWDVALEAVVAAGGTITSTSQVPNFHKLPVERRLQIQGMAEQGQAALRAAREGKAKIETDSEYLTELSTMDSAALLRVDPAKARARLDDEDFNWFLKQRRKGADPDRRVTYTDIQTIATPALNAMGLGIANKSKKERETLDPLRQQLFRRVSQWAEQKKARDGKYPDNTAIENYVDVMLTKSLDADGDVKFSFEAGDGSKIIVPREIRQRILKAAPGSSQRQIDLLYVQGVRAGRW
jgi:hypothetical protein